VEDGGPRGPSPQGIAVDTSLAVGSPLPRGMETGDDDLPEPRWRMTAPVDRRALGARVARLLDGVRARERGALDLVAAYHPSPPGLGAVREDEARLVVARAFGFGDWPRLVAAAELFGAIVADDADAVVELTRRAPELLTAPVNGRGSNWGPPLACAAQVGSRAVFDALLRIPGQDRAWALDRAVLKGRRSMAQALVDAGVVPPMGLAMGPVESLEVEGLRFLADIGAPLGGEDGDPLAPVGVLLEGYFREPGAKHACLEFYVEQGIDLPDTAPMALHRGRIDLLEAHLARDPDLPSRTFSHAELFPPEAGCHANASLALVGTPLGGAGLLHASVDLDESDAFRWLLDRGAPPDLRAEVDDEGFGGQTALFHTVVSQAWRAGRQRDAAMAAALLEAGADPSSRASIRKAIRFHTDETEHRYVDVTPLEWGERFHGREWVSAPAMELVRDAGGSCA